MNNNCKNFKIRSKQYKKYFYCTKSKKEIALSDCKNCPFKDYKEYAKLTSNKEMKKQTKVHAKKERTRSSVFTDDLTHCVECGSTNINLHEIFYGRNRQNSIDYKLVIPLCSEKHHNQVNCAGIHFDRDMCLKWQKLGQLKFEENHTREEFLNIFGKNYL